jgi:hypothetical protein
MRSLARWSSASFLLVSLACLACRAQEEGAGGKESERAAALREASEAIQTLVKTQTAEISRMEVILRAPPDLKAARDAELKKLQDEAASPGTSEARRKQILEVEIPAEKKESQADGENLKKLKEEHERAIAGRKAMQEKLTELETQLKELIPPKKSGPAEGEKKTEVKAAPKAEP